VIFQIDYHAKLICPKCQHDNGGSLEARGVLQRQESTP
jgi:hypothetical protein